MSLSTMFSNSPLTAMLLPSASATNAKAAATTSGTTTGTSGTTSTSSTTSGTDSIGSTFLSLLVQELQNQDPTAPMDSTAMVGQMISLNQLQQLTSIDQTLTTAYRMKASTAGTRSDAATSSALPGGAAQAALQLLNNSSSNAAKRAVSASVTLPAF